MRRLVALSAIIFALPAAAQNVVTSAEPEAVTLTVYRGSKEANPINKDWPTGYALITETRTVTIPAGESVVRFEGVAEGMFPESAIVTGLPNGVVEKNRDARLLSPQGLVDAYLKRQVTLTRTNKATGAVRTQDAFITAGANGGVVLQTADGYEALRCTGLPERLGYPGTPPNLSAKPTLSVVTTSSEPVTAKLTLTYMAAGFDWQANYVALVKDRKTEGPQLGDAKVDLFAWLTLANGGNQSFANANTMAIAGAPNRVARGEQPRPTGGPLIIECWPEQRTDQVPFRLGYEEGYYDLAEPVMAPPPVMYAPPPAPPPMMESIMMRDKAMSVPVAVIKAEQEDLGDLKLYRVPEPVTVNAKGQKQVAMLTQPASKFETYYGGTLGGYSVNNVPMRLMLRSKNEKEKGLGLPMPQGQVMVFEDSKYGPLLAGQDALKDRAVGDRVEMTVGSGGDVRMSATIVSDNNKLRSWKVKVTSARKSPVKIELKIPYKLKGKPANVTSIDGVPTWRVTVPANGETELSFDMPLEG